MRKFALVLAGGVGSRAGSSTPKQFLPLCGRPVLWWSMRAFLEQDPGTTVILVLHPGHFADWDASLSQLPAAERLQHRLCPGGADRTSSVGNGLKTVYSILSDEGIDPEEAFVAVHDAARPVIDAAFVARGWETVRQGLVAVPVVPCASSLRLVSPDGSSEAVNRSLYREVQTPQVACAADLIRAYSGVKGSFTDDASLLQAAGCGVDLYEGSPRNIKITYPDDIRIAEILLKK